MPLPILFPTWNNFPFQTKALKYILILAHYLLVFQTFKTRQLNNSVSNLLFPQQYVFETNHPSCLIADTIPLTPLSWGYVSTSNTCRYPSTFLFQTNLITHLGQFLWDFRVTGADNFYALAESWFIPGLTTSKSKVSWCGSWPYLGGLIPWAPKKPRKCFWRFFKNEFRNFFSDLFFCW